MVLLGLDAYIHIYINILQYPGLLLEYIGGDILSREKLELFSSFTVGGSLINSFK